MVGMLMIWNACWSAGFASTSTLTTSTAPSYFAASFSISGATILQGPHQVAQKSTTTGLSALRTSSSNVAPARHEPGAAKHGKVLAHVRHLASNPDRQLADGELALGQRFEHAQPLGV